ncbi:DHBP synthase RibB-like alpha/beta domain-containing protein [Podospora fimiseda]|uniref:Threonylcarbamoyl-AMP synthase n=1 Tax=Podospora fimiseda TaxID=252190 RepID=A0AAN7BQ39_9PEZI|nr:DHBP synthase RibB-like alpha/beta domain-containing protein [Podospora fimiseda]
MGSSFSNQILPKRKLVIFSKPKFHFQFARPQRALVFPAAPLTTHYQHFHHSNNNTTIESTTQIKMKTRILKVPLSSPGENKSQQQELGSWSPSQPPLQTWSIPLFTSPPEEHHPLAIAATALKSSNLPVAFPTETVYGLGADATRSEAVRGIYAAKGRPSDNPLIVHVPDLDMLKRFLPDTGLPEIYKEMITKFWPGPLTILLPVPTGKGGILAPEVTAGLETFGVRMPASALARTLIKLVGNPLAAPSANASTRPSPTKAEHVLEDLEGRIELILDGGDCSVGVESTVVDGLCSPPVVLRPGGVGIEELKKCKGWEGVVKGYKDHSEVGDKNGTPRAPGMKYKHYSPRARVVLFEGGKRLEKGDVKGGGGETVAFIRTGKWREVAGGSRSSKVEERIRGEGEEGGSFVVKQGVLLDEDGKEITKLLDVDLGQDVKGVAHGLFAALRELDRLGADVIFVEGVSDGDDIAAAVMNRLRKAASEIRH